MSFFIAAVQAHIAHLSQVHGSSELAFLNSNHCNKSHLTITATSLASKVTLVQLQDPTTCDEALKRYDACWGPQPQDLLSI